MTPLDRLLADGPLALTTALARRLLDTAPDAILLVRPDGTVAFANEQAERLFGYSREELAGLVLEDLVPLAPWLATAFVITALTSIGLPGTSGFVGEFLALLGTFETHPWMGGIASLGVIFAAYYMLPMVQRIFFNGLVKEENCRVPDLSRRELSILVPLVALMLWIGVQPTPFLRRMGPSIEAVLERMESGGSAQVLLNGTSPAQELAGRPVAGR